MIDHIGAFTGERAVVLHLVDFAHVSTLSCIVCCVCKARVGTAFFFSLIRGLVSERARDGGSGADVFKAATHLFAPPPNSAAAPAAAAAKA